MPGWKKHILATRCYSFVAGTMQKLIARFVVFGEDFMPKRTARWWMTDEPLIFTFMTKNVLVASLNWIKID